MLQSKNLILYKVQFSNKSSISIHFFLDATVVLNFNFLASNCHPLSTTWRISSSLLVCLPNFVSWNLSWQSEGPVSRKLKCFSSNCRQRSAQCQVILTNLKFCRIIEWMNFPSFLSLWTHLMTC